MVHLNVIHGEEESVLHPPVFARLGPVWNNVDFWTKRNNLKCFICQELFVLNCVPGCSERSKLRMSMLKSAPTRIGILQLFDLDKLLWVYNIFVYLSKSTPIDDELQPECNDEVDELPANPGPVSQRGVVVHPLPRDRDEGGVHVLVANLHFKCRIFTFLSDNPPFEWSPVWQQWCCSSSPSRPACQAVGRSAATKINF